MADLFEKLSEEELTLLRDSVACFFAAGESQNDAEALGLASFCGSSADAGLSAAVVVATEAGRARSRLPLHVSAAANLARLWSGSAPVADGGATAFAAGAYGGETGEALRLENGRLSGKLRFVEGLPAHMLLVAVDAGFALVHLEDPGVAVTETPGLGPWSLHDVLLSNAACVLLRLAADRRDEILLAYRLLIVARAQGAAQRSFELAVEHARTRQQFGQPLGRFQAMQHKLAECHVLLSATRELLVTAAETFDAGADGRHHFMYSAVAFGSDALRRAIFEIQHAFGAIGYAEEHEAAAHFRLVHAELVRFGGARSARAGLTRVLRPNGGQTPALALGEEAEAYRAKLRQWLKMALTSELRASEAAKPFPERGWNEAFAAAMGKAGLIGISWPASAGGAGRGPMEQLAFVEEFTVSEAPITSQSAASWLAGPEIIRHGSDRLRSELLPAILRGEASFCLGYSEPEAGSDLASLRTRAVRDGDSYRITGQKLWGTGTEKATHVLLAARTGGDDLPRHKGISLFVVPLSTPGITINPDLALYGHYFCTQFYDDVVVSADYRLGEENAGWEILGGALASERVLMGGTVARMRFLYQQLFTHFAASGALEHDALLVDSLGRFAAEIEAARQLALVSVRTLERGSMPLVEGAMSKLFTGDLGERFAAFAMDGLGTVGSLGEESDAVPLGGRVEQELRRSPMGVIGGGAAEVQKTIIAQRGLGLPR